MSPYRPPRPLTERSLRRAAREPAGRDPALSRVLGALGPPPLWARAEGFATLLHIILEQQVSLASARAAFQRLLVAASPLTPQRFLDLDDGALRLAGVWRPKAGHWRGPAAARPRG